MNDTTAAYLASLKSLIERIETGDLDITGYTYDAEAARSGTRNYPTGRHKFTLEVTDPARLAEHQEIGGEVIK